jgi:hypothetical protein
MARSLAAFPLLLVSRPYAHAANDSFIIQEIKLCYNMEKEHLFVI